MEKDKVEALNFGQMVQFIRVIGKMIKQMEMVD